MTSFIYLLHKTKAVFSCQAVSGPDDGKVELLSKVAERFDITEQRRHYKQMKAAYQHSDFSKLSAATNFTL